MHLEIAAIPPIHPGHTANNDEAALSVAATQEQVSYSFLHIYLFTPATPCTCNATSRLVSILHRNVLVPVCLVDLAWPPRYGNADRIGLRAGTRIQRKPLRN